jgi:uncharacterized protein DUF4383
MEAASPARLYAAVVGALLVVLGLLGFFYDASFDGLDRYEEGLGGLEVNGWLNLFYVATGGLGLLAAGVAPRGYAVAMTVLYVALAVVGWGSETLHLVIGLLGLAAVAGTPREARTRRRKPKKPRKSKPRAKPAGKRA